MKWAMPWCIAGLLAISACSPPGIRVIESNSRITFPHYSFTITPGDRWYVQRPDESKEVAILLKDAGLGMVRIMTARNDIVDARLKEASAETVADDFRDQEEQIMIERGVKAGHYQISNLRKAEETIGEKTFYVMHYSIFAGSQRQDASLYLTFPEKQANPFMVIAHYSENTAANAWLVRTHRNQFMQMLANLTVNN